MKKLLALLFLLPSVGFCDSKISAMTSTTTLAATDIIPVVVTPGSTPLNRIITYQNFLNVQNVSSVTYSGVSSIVSTGTLFDVTLSSMVMGPTNLNGSYGTSGQLYTSAGSGSTPTWTTARYGQISVSSVTSGAATTVATTIYTGVAGSSFTVTASSSTSYWIYTTIGTCFVDSGSSGTDMTVFKDGANLGDATSGLVRMNRTGVAGFDGTCGVQIWDKPADLSAHTYGTNIRAETGGGQRAIYPENTVAYFSITEVIRP